jgi:hypothetical protein
MRPLVQALILKEKTEGKNNPTGKKRGKGLERIETND